MIIGDQRLLTDLFQAYYDARKNKRNSIDAINFEIDYESKLIELRLVPSESLREDSDEIKNI